MFRRIIKNTNKTVFVVAVLILFFSLSPSFLEAGECEVGLSLCWFDYFWLPDVAIFYCGVGYIFCKKYVEN